MSDIQELFARDPLGLTDPELDSLITTLRGMRKNFNATAAPAKKAKASAGAKPSTLNLDIEL